MTRTQGPRGIRAVAVPVLALMAIALLLLLFLPARLLVRFDKATLPNVRVGMSRKDVIARFGQPDLIARSNKEIDDGGGYHPLPTAGIHDEALVYTSKGAFWRVYVFVDQHGRVSRICHART